MEKTTIIWSAITAAAIVILCYRRYNKMRHTNNDGKVDSQVSTKNNITHKKIGILSYEAIIDDIKSYHRSSPNLFRGERVVLNIIGPESSPKMIDYIGAKVDKSKPLVCVTVTADDNVTCLLVYYYDTLALDLQDIFKDNQIFEQEID